MEQVMQNFVGVMENTIVESFKKLEDKYPNAKEICEDLLKVMFKKGDTQSVVFETAEVAVKSPKKPSKAKKAAAKKEVEPEEEKVVEETVVVGEEEEKPKKASKSKKTAAKKEKEEVEEEEEGEEEEEEKPKPKAKKASKSKKVTAETGPVNLEKLTPTQTKKLKSVSEELKVEADKVKFIEYCNALTAEVYNSKKLEQHMRSFLVPPVPEPEAEEKEDDREEKELTEVIFKDETYFIDPETKNVYTENGDYLGKVGLGKYAEMKL